MMDFRPGDFVECVDDSPPQFGRAVLTRGRLYTVSEVLAAGDSHPACPLIMAPEDIIDLEEAPRPPQISDGVVAYGWRVCRFRRVYRRDPGLIARLMDAAIAI
jgi:hypothetical protein